MSIEIRPIVDDEIEVFRASLVRGFGGDLPDDDDGKGADRFRSLMPLERTVAAFDSGRVVGTLGDFPLHVTVPGGAQLAMAGTTMVTVEADHTRRGLLRSMMRLHLDNAVKRQEPVAGLWASEPGIYGRFGFGLASQNHAVTIDSRHIDSLPIADDLELMSIQADDLNEIVAPFWSGCAQQLSGFIDRSAARWQDIVSDPEHHREGATKGRHVVARRSGNVVGYLAYRQRDKWNDFVADGAIEINTLVGADTAAQLALWTYAMDVDLFPHVRFWNGAVDDPLAAAVSNARVVQRKLFDALYVRILDVPVALKSRSYESDGEVSIRVEDSMGYCDGTYVVSVRDGTAKVAESSGPADVQLDIRELGALVLGRRCADLYASLGHISGDPAAVNRLGRLMVTSRAPWCPEMF